MTFIRIQDSLFFVEYIQAQQVNWVTVIQNLWQTTNLCFYNIISDYENKCEKKCDHCQQCQKCLQWEKKQFHMGTVMPIFSKVNIEGKYVLLKSSVNSIKKTFEDLIKTEEPHVFVFATCFSHYSEINYLLYSCGLYSALTISKEHGDKVWVKKKWTHVCVYY